MSRRSQLYQTREQAASEIRDVKLFIRWAASVAVLTLSGTGPACRLFSGAYDVLGSVADATDEPQFNVTTPVPAARNTPFAVTFYTLGGGCIRRSARTEVKVNGNVAEIRPYDRRDPDSGCCLCDDLLMISHRADVTIAQQGSAVVRVRGTNVVERTVRID